MGDYSKPTKDHDTEDTTMTEQDEEEDSVMESNSSQEMKTNTRETQVRRGRGRGRGGVKLNRASLHAHEMTNKSNKNEFDFEKHDKFIKFIPTRSRIRNLRSVTVPKEKPKGRVLRKRKISIEDESKESEDDTYDSDREIKSKYLKVETKEEKYETVDSF